MEFTDALYRMMDREIPILTAEIRALYQNLDAKFHLHGASVPISFGYEEESLGSYTPAHDGETDEFHFSLLFLARCVSKPLTKEDRQDLFLHEYAHYMQYHIDIPKEYTWQSGIHGSAWKYCCSLVGAAPTPYYKAGEGLLKHDYDAVLQKKSLTDPSIPLLDQRRREQEYRASKDRIVQYQIGETVTHPKYGAGQIVDIQQQNDAVRLIIAFSAGEKIIDQKWFLQNTRYKRAGDK